MTEDAINIVLNGGSVAILLFILIKVGERFDSLQRTLHETNMRMWALLERLVENDEDLTASQIRKYNPPPEAP